MEFSGVSEIARIPAINGRTRAFILVGVIVGLGVFVYRGALCSFIISVLHREDASHGLCVPFISAYLVWLRLEKVKELRPQLALVPGLVMVAAGLLLFFLAGRGTEVALAALSFLLLTAGLVVGLFGKDMFKELGFPLFYLATMIPLPKPLYAQLTECMRVATTWGSVRVLQLFDFPICREGYNIYLPNMSLFVADSCSGIRYLIPYFVFGLAYAFVCKKTTKSRILVVLATIPLSIIGGVFRQSFIFLSAYYVGPFMAEHRPHIMISWTVFVGVLAGAIWMDRTLSRAQSAKGIGKRRGVQGKQDGLR